MVGPIANVLPAVPPPRVRAHSAFVHSHAARRDADRIDIANFGVSDFAQSHAGDSALGEISGILGEVKSLFEHADAHYSSDDAASRQLKIDSLLAGIDRLRKSTHSTGPMAALNATTLGAAPIDGTTYSLADLRTGGAFSAVSGDSNGASKVLNTALAQIAGARSTLSSTASDNATSNIANSLKSIRDLMLSSGDSAVSEGNRPAIFHMLKA